MDPCEFDLSHFHNHASNTVPSRFPSCNDKIIMFLLAVYCSSKVRGSWLMNPASNMHPPLVTFSHMLVLLTLVLGF